MKPEGPLPPEGGDQPVAAEIGARLGAAGETVAVAETSAGGLIAGALVAVPGASAWFLGGVVPYSGAAKARWLDLPPERFRPDGVVSPTGAALLAGAVRDTLGATWGLAEVGIAGPQAGRRSGKSEGLAYVAVAGPRSIWLEVTTGARERAANQRAFAAAALLLFRQVLAGGD